MGIGSAPAGAGPAGLDLPASTEQRQAATPVALAFDGQTLDFKLDENGRYVSAHPVDTKVFHRLRIRKLSIRSAPGTGNDVGNSQWIEPRTIEAEVRDHVRVATEDMIVAGEIEDRGIELDLTVRGRVAYRYNYWNRLSGKPGSFRFTT
jgi:hypothetical protein